MRRWLSVLGILAIVLLVAPFVQAANMACTTSVVGSKIAKITYTILSDDAAGTATCTISGIEGYVMRVVVVPNVGGTQPTNAWDFTLSDGQVDILGGRGTDMSNAANTNILPYTGIDAFPPAVSGTLAISCTNMGNAKTAVVYVYFERP